MTEAYIETFRLLEQVVAAVPWWLKAVGIVYLLIAFMAGCPYCGQPALAWPKKLVPRLDEDGDAE